MNFPQRLSDQNMLWLKSLWLHKIFMYMLFYWEMIETKTLDYLNFGKSQQVPFIVCKIFQEVPRCKICYFIRSFYLLSQNLVTVHSNFVCVYFICIYYIHILIIHVLTYHNMSQMFIHTTVHFIYIYILHPSRHYTYIGTIKSVCSHLNCPFLCTYVYQVIYQGLS